MASSKQVVKWLGKRVCDICGDVIIDELYDAKTVWRCWATMDKKCFDIFGYHKLGLGIGQKYKQISKEFIKVEG